MPEFSLLALATFAATIVFDRFQARIAFTKAVWRTLGLLAPVVLATEFWLTRDREFVGAVVYDKKETLGLYLFGVPVETFIFLSGFLIFSLSISNPRS